MSSPSRYNATTRRILLSAPAAGAAVSVKPEPGARFIIDFPLASASFLRQGAALKIVFADGGSITILDYFAVTDGKLPVFQLEDGTEMGAASFLRDVAPEMDLSVARKPDSGSGVGPYRSDAGELVDALEKMDSLEAPALLWAPTLIAAPIIELPSRVLYRENPLLPPPPSDISIERPFGGARESVAVFESALAEGTAPGDGVRTGWNALELPEGVSIVGVGEGASATFATAHGVLTVRHIEGGRYVYRFELLRPLDNNGEHPSISPDGEELISLPISDGYSSGTIKIAVAIVEDAPLVMIDGDQAAVFSGYRATGVFAFNFGADGPGQGEPLRLDIYAHGNRQLSFEVDASLPGEYAVVIGGTQYGILRLDPVSGRYEFRSAPNTGSIELELVLTARDRDGDSASARASFSVSPVAGPAAELLGAGDDEWFSEALLPGGSAYAGGDGLTKAIALPEGYGIDTGAGWTRTPGGGFYLNTQYGRLDCDSSGQNLTYTLISAPLTPGGRDGDSAQDLLPGISLVDEVGNRAELPLAIRIMDDSPEVSLGAAGSEVFNGKSLEGDWSVIFGADGPSERSALLLEVRAGGGSASPVLLSITPDQALEVRIDGRHLGTLTLHSGTGRFTFEAGEAMSGDVRFSLLARDGDGDLARADLDLNILHNVVDPGIRYLGEEGIEVSEAHLPGGSAEGDGPLRRVIAVPEGFTIDTEQGGWTREPGGEWRLYSPDGPGYLSLWEPGSPFARSGMTLTYTLERGMRHDGSGRDVGQDIIPGIVLKNAAGDEFVLDVRVDVRDDAPIFSMELHQDSVECGSSFTGNLGLVFGADGMASEQALTMQLSVTSAQGVQSFSQPVTAGQSTVMEHDGVVYGILTLNADYSFVFKTSPNLSHSLSINFSATDGDGDVSRAYEGGMALLVSPPSVVPPSVFGRGESESFSEAHLLTGTASDEAACSKLIAIPEPFTIDPSDWTRVGGEGSSIYEKHSPSAYGKLIYDAAANTLRYELSDRLAHAAMDDDSPKVVDDVFQVTLQDANGNTFVVNAGIAIYDDAPELSMTAPDGACSMSGFSGAECAGDWTVHFGADGPDSARDSGLDLVVEILIYQLDVYGNVLNHPDTGLPVTKSVSLSYDLPTDFSLIDLHDGTASYGTVLFTPSMLRALAGSNVMQGSFSFVPAPNVRADYTMHLGAYDDDGDYRMANNGEGFRFSIAPPEGPGVSSLGGGDSEWFDERHLAEGTAFDPSQNTRRISLPDGYRVDVAGGGWTQGASPDAFVRQSGNGYLTYHADSGRLYFTLTAPAEHGGQGAGPGDRSYVTAGSVTLLDANNNAYQVGTRFTVYDDQPSLSLSGGPEASGGNAYTGSWSLAYGADGPATSRSLVLELSVDGSSLPSRAIEVGRPFSLADGAGGALGTLTLMDDGTFRFVPAPNITREISLGLAATDGDGDLVRNPGGSLTISVSPPPGPDVDELRLREGAVLREANLADGTSPDADSLEKEFSLPRGYRVDVSGWRDLGNGEFELAAGRHGVLRYDGERLTYTLRQNAAHEQPGRDSLDETLPPVRLLDAVGNSYQVGLAVTIEDDTAAAGLRGDVQSVVSGDELSGSWAADYGADGPNRTAPLQVLVRVDGNERAFTVQPGGGAVVIELDGHRYGELRLGSGTEGGRFSFKAYPNQPAANLSFRLAATDSEGDVSLSSEIPVQITSPAGPGLNYIGGAADEVFYEEHLGWGSSPASGELTKSLDIPRGYTIDVNRPVTVEGQARSWFQPDPGTQKYTLATSYGLLTYSAGPPPSLAYTLQRQAGHRPGDGANETVDSIQGLTFVDSLGNIAGLDAGIRVVDDLPGASFGGIGRPEITSGHGYTGFWNAEYGADGESSGADRLYLIVRHGASESARIAIQPGQAADVRIAGTSYGSIVFDQSSGRYLFTAAPNLDASLDFTLYAVDADGDTASSGGAFTIVVRRAEDPDLPGHLGGNAEESFNEAHLTGNGSHASGTSPDATLLTQDLRIPSGYEISTNSGWTSLGGERWTRSGEHGFLTYDANANRLTYTLTTAPDEPGAGRNLAMDAIPGIVLKDAWGNTFALDAQISIIDDIPVVSFGSAGGGNISMGSGTTFQSGSWDVDFGADGAAASGALVLRVSDDLGGTPMIASVSPGAGPVAVMIGNRLYGYLTINSDNTFSFKAEPNLDVRLRFTLGATDGDGDTVSSAGFRITIVSPEGPQVSHLGLEALFREADLENGSNPDQAALTQAIRVPQGFRVDIHQPGWVLQADGQTYRMQGAKGFLSCSSDGKTLRYTLERPVHNDGSDTVDHDGDSGFDDIPGIRLLDANNNEFYLGARIEISDDAPAVDFMDNAVLNLASGAAFDSGQGGYILRYGADGAALSGELAVYAAVGSGNAVRIPVSVGTPALVTINSVVYGTLTLNADGTFSFRARENLGADYPVRLKLSLEAADADGDVEGTRDTPVTFVISKPAGPAPGFSIGGNGERFSEAHLPDGSSAQGGQLTKELTLPPGYVPDTGGWTQAGGVFHLQGTYGRLTWDGSRLTYTLEREAHNTPPGSGNDQSFPDDFGSLVLKDANGNTYQVHAEITVLDDVPSPAVSAWNDEVASGASFTGSFAPNYGADGPAGKNPLQLRAYLDNGDETVVVLTADNAAHELWINGTLYGTVRLGADGASYTFTAGNNLDARMYLALGARDGDGDFRESQPVPVRILSPEGPGVAEIGKGSDEWFSESNLLAGPGNPHAGTAPDAGELTKDIALPQGFFVNTASGWAHQGGGVYTRAGSHGVLTYSENAGPPRSASLAYTLQKHGSHGDPARDGADDVIFERIPLLLEDALGNTFSLNTKIRIFDDAPDLAMTATGGAENASGASGREFTGQWSVDFGADGPGTGQSATGLSLSVSITFWPTDGEGNVTGPEQQISLSGLSIPQDFSALTLTDGNRVYGVITFTESPVGSGKGSFVFKPSGNIKADFDFALKATDGDGDVRTANDGGGFSFSVTPATPPLPENAALLPESDLDEAALANGTGPDPDALTVNIPLPQGSGGVVYSIDVTQGGWQNSGGGIWTLRQANGLLTYDKASNSLRYTLEGRFTHGGPGEDVQLDQAISVVITDGENSWSRNVLATVVDDAPELSMTAAGGSDSASGASGREFTGQWNANFGADGPGTGQSATGLTLSVTVTYWPTDGEGNVTGPEQQISLSGLSIPQDFSALTLTDGNRVYGVITFTESPVGSGKGSFVFKPSGNIKADFDFALKATDGDGDVRTANDGGGFSFSVTPATPPLPGNAALLPESDLDEAALANGTGPDPDALTVNIPLPQGSGGVVYSIDVTQGGWQTSGGGIWTLRQANGLLTYDKASNSLRYTLEGRFTHGGPGEDVQLDQAISVVITDGENSWSRNVLATVVDDAPELSMTAAGGAENASGASGREFSGQWNVNFGADGPGTGQSTTGLTLSVTVTYWPTDAEGNLTGPEQQISLSDLPIPQDFSSLTLTDGNRVYGVITFAENPAGSGKGSFVFKPSGNMKADFDFALKGTDADGDTSTANSGDGFSFSVTPATPPLPGNAALLPESDLDEAALANGTGPDPDALTVNIPLPQGSGGVVYSIDVTQGGWQNSGGVWTLRQGNGLLTYDKAANTLRYTLEGRFTHGGPGEDAQLDQAISVVITDGENSWSRNVLATVVDDAPELSLTSGTGSEDGSGSSGREFSGLWSVNFGADGAGTGQSSSGLDLLVTIIYWPTDAEGNVTGPSEQVTIPALAVPTDGSPLALVYGGKTYGSISFTEDSAGSATGGFVFKPAGNLKADFVFELRATDGDGDVRVANGGNGFSFSVAPVEPPLAEDEFLIPEEPVDEANLAEGSDPSVGGLTVNIPLPSTADGRQCGIDVGQGGWVLDHDDVWVLVSGNGKLTYDREAGSLSYTLLTRFEHGTPGAVDDEFLEHGITVAITDGDNTWQRQVKATVMDDAPDVRLLLSDGSSGGQGHGGDEVSGTWSVHYGADGPPSDPSETGLSLGVTIDLYATDDEGNLLVPENVTRIPLEYPISSAFGEITLEHLGVVYGKVRFLEDVPGSRKGSFSFTPAGNMTAEFSLNLGATDSEGDHSIANQGGGLAFLVTKPPAPVAPDAFLEAGELDEASLAEGTSPSPSGLSSGIPLPEFAPGRHCTVVVDQNWQQVGGQNVWTLTSGGGRLRYDADANTLTYELVGRFEHELNGASDELADHLLRIVISDGDNTWSRQVKAVIRDDVPEADFSGSGGARDDQGYSGREYTGEWEADFGADGAPLSGSGLSLRVRIKVYDSEERDTFRELELSLDVPQDFSAITLQDADGVYGSITLDETPPGGSGSFIFKPSGNLHADFDFNLVAKDSEGDVSISSSANGFTIEVSPPDAPVAEGDPLSPATALDESRLAGGTSPDSGALTVAIPLVGQDGEAFFIDVSQGGWIPKASGVYTLTSGSGMLTYTVAGNTLEYTLLDRFVHGRDTTDTLTAHRIPVVITDGQNTWSHYVSADVIDDAPTLSMTDDDDNASANGGSGKSFTGEWSVNFGADGAAQAAEEGDLAGLTLNVVITVTNRQGEGAPLPEAEIVTLNLALPEDFSSIDLIKDGVRYGTITFTESAAGSRQGSFVFTPAGNLTAGFDFNLTAADSEGDSSIANSGQGFSFAVTPPVPPIAVGATLSAGSFDEENLAKGSNPSDSALSRQIQLPEYETGQRCRIDVSQGGWRQEQDGMWVLEQGGGRLTYDADANSLRYTLIDAFTHDIGSGNGDSLGQNISVVLTDGANTWSRDVSATIVDDAPAAGIGQYQDDPLDVMSGQEFVGNWDIAYGADGAPEDGCGLCLLVNLVVYQLDVYGTPLTDGQGRPVTQTLNLRFSVPDDFGQVVIQDGITTYGVIRFDLVDDQTGQRRFSFTPSPNLKADISLLIEATDADGDKSVQQTPLEIEVNVPDGPNINHIGEDAGTRFHESNLKDGTARDESQLTKVINVPDGYSIDTGGSLGVGVWTDTGDGNIFRKTGANGYLTYNKAENTLTYTLTDRYGHAAPGQDGDGTALGEVGEIVLSRDSDGNTYACDTGFAIVDDAPVVVFEGAADARSGHAYSGQWSVSFGADKAAARRNR